MLNPTTIERLLSSGGAKEAATIAAIGWLALKVHEHEHAIRDLKCHWGGLPVRQTWVEREHERREARSHGHGRE